jgi:membrane protein DedA with SNARE-associated domain
VAAKNPDLPAPVEEPSSSSPAVDSTTRRQAATEWIEERWPSRTRQRVAIAIAFTAIVIGALMASTRFLRIAFPNFELIAYVSLFVTCWIGAGGAIVPVPGVRLVSWLLIVQQGAALEPIAVAGVAAIAMVTGQSSIFFAARAAATRVRERTEWPDSEAVPDGAAPPGDDAEPSRRARYVARAEQRVKLQIKRHGFATVFAVCALPTPLTTVTTTAAASSGMSYPRYFIAALSGYLVLASILVLVGQGLFAGIRSIVG